MTSAPSCAVDVLEQGIRSSLRIARTRYMHVPERVVIHNPAIAVERRPNTRIDRLKLREELSAAVSIDDELTRGEHRGNSVRPSRLKAPESIERRARPRAKSPGSPLCGFRRPIEVIRKAFLSLLGRFQGT